MFLGGLLISLDLFIFFLPLFNRNIDDEVIAFSLNLSGFDIIISPTFGGRQMLITNLTGHPALSIPNGFNKKNSPTSITLLGNYFEEGKILSFAHLIQKESNFHTKKPPRFY